MMKFLQRFGKIKIILQDGKEIILYKNDDVRRLCTFDGRRTTEKMTNCGVLANYSHYFHPEDVVGIEFLPGWDMESIPDGFMQNCTNLNSPFEIPNCVKHIGDYFLSYCEKFDSNIVFSKNLETIGNWFMNENIKFDQVLSFSNTKLHSIGDFFLRRCIEFGSGFGYLNITRSKIEPGQEFTIGSDFMYGCVGYNSPIILPLSLYKIGNNFMQHCDSFNDTLSLSPNIQSIGAWFMNGCVSFNRDLHIPDRVTYVGNYFMYNCINMKSSVFIHCPVAAFGISGATDMFAGAPNSIELYVKESDADIAHRLIFGKTDLVRANIKLL